MESRPDLALKPSPLAEEKKENIFRLLLLAYTFLIVSISIQRSPDSRSRYGRIST